METIEPDGLTCWTSSDGFETTLSRLQAALGARGLAILADIDHAAAAAAVGLQLRPTHLLMFGNPRVGTRLMQSVQTVGIDLPLKVLIWLDEAGTTWLGYNEPSWFAARHHARSGLDTVLSEMRAVLTALADEVTRRAT